MGCVFCWKLNITKLKAVHNSVGSCSGITHAYPHSFKSRKSNLGVLNVGLSGVRQTQMRVFSLSLHGGQPKRLRLFFFPMAFEFLSL